MTIKKLTMNVLMMTLVVGLAFLASVKIAFSQPILYEGDSARVQKTLLCDTEEILTIIVEAILEDGWIIGYQIGKRTVIEMGLNSRGTQRCTGTGLEGFAFVLVKVVNVFEDVGWPSGDLHTTYIVAVLWEHRTQGTMTGFILTTWPIFPREEEPKDDAL